MRLLHRLLDTSLHRVVNKIDGLMVERTEARMVEQIDGSTLGNISGATALRWNYHCACCFTQCRSSVVHSPKLHSARSVFVLEVHRVCRRALDRLAWAARQAYGSNRISCSFKSRK